MSGQDDPAEVARALEYRLAQRERNRLRNVRLRALSGSRTARVDLAGKFQAVVARPEDRREEWDGGR